MVYIKSKHHKVACKCYVFKTCKIFELKLKSNRYKRFFEEIHKSRQNNTNFIKEIKKLNNFNINKT